VFTGDLRTADLHNRKFLIRHEKISTNQHRLILSLAGFSTNYNTFGAFTNDTALLNKQAVTNTLDSSDDLLRVKFTHKRHRGYAGTPASRWDAYPGFFSIRRVTQEMPFRKGDLAGICLNVGRVSKTMLNIHAQEIWSMERTIEATPSATNTVSAEVFQGTVAYLMGMAFHERVGRFREINQTARQTVWDEVAPFIWKRMGSPLRVLDPAGGRGEFLNAIPADERWLLDIVDYDGPITAGDLAKQSGLTTGAVTAVPGSPIPPGASVLRTRCTSIGGVSFILKTR